MRRHLHSRGRSLFHSGVVLLDAARGYVNPAFAYSRSGAIYVPQQDRQLMSVASDVLPRYRDAALGWAYRFDPGWTNLAQWGCELTADRGWTPNGAIVPAVDVDGLTPPAPGVSYTRLTCDGLSPPTFYRTATVTPGQVVTMSAMVRLGTMAAGNYLAAFYDATNSAFVATQLAPDSAPNATGWTRCNFSCQVPAGCTSLRFYPMRNNAPVAGTVYLSLVNLTNTTYPAPLTLATSSAVTVGNASMVAALASMGLSLPGEYSAFAEFVAQAVPTNGQVLNIDTNSGVDRFALRADLAATSVRTFAVTAGSSGGTNTGPYSLGAVCKAAARVSSSMLLETYFDGNAGSGLGPIAMPAAPTHVRFGAPASGAERLCGGISRSAIFPRALPDAQLQALTR